MLKFCITEIVFLFSAVIALSAKCSLPAGKRIDRRLSYFHHALFYGTCFGRDHCRWVSWSIPNYSSFLGCLHVGARFHVPGRYAVTQYHVRNQLLTLNLIDSFLRTWTMVGLTLMAVGAGGVKPCVAPFGGDQFHLPLQQKLLQQFFSLFYFTANLGGLAGMLVTPLLRQAVSCFGNEFCYSLAFGLPAVLAVFSVGESILSLTKIEIYYRFSRLSRWKTLLSH